MYCPICREVTLVIADRQGIEIDYCPNCRGVWLDRGELDKIIERSAAYTKSSDINQGPTYKENDYKQDHKQYPQQGGHYHDPYNKHKKKKGFLGDFFDFD
jgi:Zn-finger nucleic acid-binding protein